jgi:GNAT superfamily N-acetyltransferase
MGEREDLLAAYDADGRRWTPPTSPAGERYEHLGSILRVVGRQRGFIDPAPDLGVAGDALDGLICEQRDFFAARGEAVEWKTRGHDRPAEVPERLVAAGFVPEDQETVMIGPAHRLAVESAPPPEVVIRQVTARRDFERVAALESEVWSEDLGSMAGELYAQAEANPAEMLVFVAEVERQVVSAAWLTIKPGTGFAGLWGGATLPGWRGRGVYRALVAHRAKLAASRGVRYLQVDASDESRPILSRLGLVAVTTTTPYVWTPASAE